MREAYDCGEGGNDILAVVVVNMPQFPLNAASVRQISHHSTGGTMRPIWWYEVVSGLQFVWELIRLFQCYLCVVHNSKKANKGVDSTRN
jgi:hypothetical protein